MRDHHLDKFDRTPAEPVEPAREQAVTEEIEREQVLDEELAGPAQELTRQRDSGEISDEDYEERMAELEQAERDLQRAEELEED